MHFRHLIARLLLLIVLCLFGAAAFGQTRKPFAIPVEVSNNIVLMQVSVNNSKPLSFILDTGASGTVISESRAKELGLKLEGQTDASTQGGSIGAAYVKDALLQLSKDAELPKTTLTAIRLNGLDSGFGRRIDGILGYEIFNRYVVEIDYASKVVRFHEPQTFKYPGRGETIPISIEENTPFVRAKVATSEKQSFEGEFLINTGSTGTLYLNSAFVARNKLLRLVPNAKSITFGALLAGKSAGRIGRMNSLQFGGIVVANPVTNFSQNTEGDDATEFGGMIGSEVLRRFKLIIDYSRKQITLEPSEQVTEPYEFDMSGASLAAGGKGFKIFKVRTLIENSPATEAGLRVGDIITAIDGKPTTEMTLEQIRQMFKRGGQKYELSIKRDATFLRVNMKTRRIV